MIELIKNHFKKINQEQHIQKSENIALSIYWLTHKDSLSLKAVVLHWPLYGSSKHNNEVNIDRKFDAS